MSISSSELRENLAHIRKRVMAGETIDVSYRGQPVMRISPIADDQARYNGSEVGKRLDVLLKKLPSVSHGVRNPCKDYTQLRDEVYRRDPRYQRYFEGRTTDE